MKIVAAVFIAASMLLISVPAGACSLAYIERMAPNSQWDVELPRSGSLYFASNFAASLPSGLQDPEGVEVQWEIGTADFDNSVQTATPEGGWLVGEYVYSEWTDDSGLPVVGFRITDFEDTTPPDVTIKGWSGQNSYFDPAPCGGGQRDSGVYLEIGSDEEWVVHQYEVHDDVGLVSTGLLFPHETFVPAHQGSTISITVRSYDLSGNMTETVLTDAQACGGCSGDVVGRSAAPLGALALLMLVGLRRR